VLGLLERGFLASEAGPEVVRVTPPLTVDAAAVDAFCAAFGDVVDHTAPRPAEEARR
jgi:acetylornithine/succinyldiaminopimelate/putrescine aminotransferase